MNPNYVAVVKHDIDKLLTPKFIHPIEEATWLSPIMVVPKKNGKLKICVDYKKLNAAPKKDPYPLPFIDEVVNTIVGHDAYSFLDGYFGYTIIQIQNNLCNKLRSFYLGNDAFWSETWTSYLPKRYLNRTFRNYLDNHKDFSR